MALADDAYDALLRRKKPGQSFSDVVRELTEHNRPRVRDVAGLLAHDDAYWAAFTRTRRQARGKTVSRARLDHP